MQNPKYILFLYLTPRQKSMLLNTLKAYCSNFKNLNSEELTNKFLEDEKYYLDIKNPHFEFVKKYLKDDKFYRETVKFFDFCLFELEQKEKMKPYLEKQKELMKVQRKKASEFKMSKQKPTKKQLLYYDKLTKAYRLDKKDVSAATKLDLRDWIKEILDKHDGKP